MNLLYRGGSSKDNFQLNLLESLRNDGVFEKCTVLSQTLDDGDQYPKEFYHELVASQFYFGRYETVCDINSLPSVPIEIWEDMRMYKDDILNMTMRPFNTHLYNYFDMDVIYSHAVRFWNWILDSDEIGMFFSIVCPHTPWEMTIYSLCKVKDIPVLIVDEHWMQGLGTVFTDILHNGINVKKCYDKYNRLEVDEQMQKWYDNCVTTRLSYNKASKKANMLDNRAIDKRLYYSTWYKDAYYVLLQYARRLIKGKSVQKDVDFFKCLAISRHEARKTRNNCKDIYWYDRKYAKDPVSGEQYILYLLQYMPEATLLPKSGVCSNQIIAARILAEGAAKAGVKLYIKEHYAQCPRPDSFYQELMAISNIRLIKLDEPTGPLQDNAIAIASQTGRCLLESMVKSKPFFSLAYNPVAEAPGGYMIRNAEDVYTAIKEIQAGVTISDDDTRRFYGALYKTSVKCNLDYGRHMKYNYGEVHSDIMGLIKAFTAAGMPNDFYYERND